MQRGPSIICAALITIGLATPVAAQRSKDALRFPLKNAESVIDPYLSPGSFHNTWAPPVFDNLVGFSPKKGEFVPLLAKSWTQPDPTTYDFELRDDVKWHDGEAFDADDAVYILNYLIDPKVTLRYKSNWAWIKSVEKLGSHKLRITAKTPVADGLMWLVNSTPIYPQHLHGPIANKLDFGARPVGTGPYKVAQLDKNTGVVIERNPGFKAGVAKPAARFGRIIAEPIPESGTLTAALLTGQADVAEDLPIDQAQALRDSGKFEVTLQSPGVGYTFMGFPTKGWQTAKPLADARVRLAIVKAIDRKELGQVLFGAFAGGIEPAEGLCLKQQRGCGFTKSVPGHDPAGAKRLLAEAGYADGFDVAISTFRLPGNIVQATALSGMLRKVGIRATVNPHLISARVQLIDQGKVEIGYYGWSGSAMLDVSPQIVRHFLSNEYDDPELAKLALPTFSIMDDAERRKAAARLFDYATDKAYAFAMLPNRSSYTHTKEVKLDAKDDEVAIESVINQLGWK